MTFEEMFHRAAGLQSQGDLPAALRAYAEIPVELIADNVAYARGVYWNLGACRLATGDPLGAARSFKAFLDQYPDAEDFWRNFFAAAKEACRGEGADFMSVVCSLARVETAADGFVNDTVLAFLFDTLSAAGAVTFLNIGANDGLSYNPLSDHVRSRRGWRGVMVEPNPAVFRRLAANYAGFPDVATENVCIGDHDGLARFFIPAPAVGLGNPVLDQIGSLDRAHVVRHLAMFFPDLEDPDRYVEETEVEVLTVASILRRCGLERADVIVTDAEGHDATILDGLDLERLAPAVTLFERKHMSDADKVRIDGKFAAAGYRLFDLGADGLAVRGDVVGSETLDLVAKIVAATRRLDSRILSHKKALDILLWINAQDAASCGRPSPSG